MRILRLLHPCDLQSFAADATVSAHLNTHKILAPLFLPFMLFMLQPLTCVAQTAAAVPNPPAACSDHLKNWKLEVIDCLIAAATESRDYVLRVSFSGSHDDTFLALVNPTLDGRELPCASGSKTKADFEDGDVVLSCRLTLPAVAQAMTLTTRVNFEHAQYEGFRFEPR